VAAAPSTPDVPPQGSTLRRGRHSYRSAAATRIVTAAPNSWFAASGIRPASPDTCPSAMNSTPKPAPAAAPSTSAPRVLAVDAVDSRETSQMPGRATRTPSHASHVGRSPRATPTRTGSTAAPTADTGATSPIRPRESPRNRKMLPVADPAPASSAQAKSAARGSAGASSPQATISAAPHTWPTSTIAHGECRREPVPPTKSEAP
jgi:hypothetical protein